MWSALVASRAMDISSKVEDRIKRFERTAKKTVSARSSSSSEYSTTDIFDDRTNQMAYSDPNSDGKELPRERRGELGHRKKEERNLKKSK